MSSKKSRTRKNRNKGQGKNKSKDRSRNRRPRPQGRSGRRPRSTVNRPRKRPVKSPEPVVEEPVVEEPVVEEPVVEEPVVEEPVVEEPVVEEPVVEEPVVEEPVAEEPVAEEPVALRPVVVQPAPWRPRPVGVVTVRDSTRRRRRLSVVGTVGVLLLLCAGVVAAWLPILRHSGGSGPGASARPGPFAPPTTVAVGSAYVVTEVLPGGRLRVTHWLHTSRPQETVRLGFPSSPGVTQGAMSVSHVVLAADDQRVYAPASFDGKAEIVPVPAAHQIYVSYVLSGAIERSQDQPGRALARPAALDVTTAESATRSIYTIEGAKVLALACSPNRADALPRPCGTVNDGSWAVDLRSPHADDSVMAQLDLG